MEYYILGRPESSKYPARGIQFRRQFRVIAGKTTAVKQFPRRNIVPSSEVLVFRGIKRLYPGFAKLNQSFKMPLALLLLLHPVEFDKCSEVLAFPFIELEELAEGLN